MFIYASALCCCWATGIEESLEAILSFCFLFLLLAHTAVSHTHMYTVNPISVCVQCACSPKLRNMYYVLNMIHTYKITMHTSIAILFISLVHWYTCTFVRSTVHTHKQQQQHKKQHIGSCQSSHFMFNRRSEHFGIRSEILFKVFIEQFVIFVFGNAHISNSLWILKWIRISLLIAPLLKHRQKRNLRSICC